MRARSGSRLHRKTMPLLLIILIALPLLGNPTPAEAGCEICWVALICYGPDCWLVEYCKIAEGPWGSKNCYIEQSTQLCYDPPPYCQFA